MVNDEREQTLNQLLTELDGFESEKDKGPVICIAATNRPDVSKMFPHLSFISMQAFLIMTSGQLWSVQV